MAIILPGGFNILNNEPVDARLTLADETTRYALSSANVYEGLIVFQQDNDTVWILTDTSNVGNSNGWTQLQIGSVSSNLPSGVVSSSQQILDYDIFAITGSNTFVGNQVISGSVDIQNSISSINYIDFRDGSSTTYQEGRLFYDENEGALSFYNNEADITLNLGQEFYKKAFNSSGATILNGTPVRVSGSQGDMPLIWPATAPDHSNTFGVFENHIIGVATHDIEDSSTGYVTEKGVVRNLNTSAFAAGDNLYLQTGSPATPEDYYRNTPPPFPYDIIQVGTVIRSNPGNGFIEVSSREPVHFGIISGLSGSSFTTGDLWVRKSNNSWTPSKILEGDYTIVGNISASSYSGVISSSAQIDVTQTQNYDEVVQISGSQTIVGEKTFGGTQTFQNIAVNGTGSFAYIQSVTGSAKIIGDAYIILNNNTPSERYAGIAVYDSGSVIPTTASLNFDGQTNDWFYEYSASTVDYGVVIFGPEYNTKGNPTYLTANTIPKSEGTHHLNDSNISDDGSTITLNSNVQVNGNISVTGTVDGIYLQNLSSSVDNRLDTLEGETHENPLSFVDTNTINFTRTVDNIFADVIGGVVSGSSQVSYPDLSNIPSGIVSGSTQITPLLPTGVVSGSSQITPLLPTGVVSGSSQVNADSITNFDSNVLSYNNSLGVVSGSSQITKTLQEVTTAGNTTDTTISITNNTASTSKTTGALIVSGGIGTSGDIFAGGDVVAYASSDRRLKDNILPIENPLQKINQISGYSFDWNVEKQNIYSGKDYGVIAQEIEEILPELVETRENGYKAVKYEKLVSLLIEGIKDLSKQVEDLKEKINKG